MKRLIISSVLLALLSACAHQNVEPPVSFLGDPAPVNAATRTIDIHPNTKWVNVVGGDTVRFRVGDKDFAWAFNVAATINAFDLNRVAPPGVLDHHVIAYVAPDPRYMGGDGEHVGGVR